MSTPVELDLHSTVNDVIAHAIESDPETYNPFIEGDRKFMADTYIFSIVSDDEIIIDRGFYAVNDGDPFVRDTRAAQPQMNPPGEQQGLPGGQ